MDTAIESVLRRDRTIVVVSLGVITLLAWGYTLQLAHGMNMGAASPLWSWMEFPLMFIMWTVMMVGMMTPSAAPMILLYARVGRQAALQEAPLAATGFFAGGYLLAWTVFSLAATLAQWGLQQVLLLTPMLASASGIFSGLMLLAAGVFQWTPAKQACLKHCQAPLAFIQRHGGFRREPMGSLRLGMRHGMYCTGCCWALMALLFVGGVMNVLWIAALSIFVLAEKAAPAGKWIPRLAGSLLVGWGSWLIVAAT